MTTFSRVSSNGHDPTTRHDEVDGVQGSEVGEGVAVDDQQVRAVAGG
jgi:hypothetical protein